MNLRFHTLRQEQWVSRPIDEVFEFFSDAQNLETITPPWLSFKVLSMSTKSIVQDTEIHYRLAWHGFPLRWTSKICKWNPPHSFTDTQTSGPYRLWYHRHRFEAHGGRTRVLDVARYALPFGVFGEMAHAIKVRRDVQQIFAFRRRRIDEIFGESKNSAA
jgi:ligand-binding SRPBCC domain-containing protein